jgi:hypothetical protein
MTHRGSRMATRIKLKQTTGSLIQTCASFIIGCPIRMQIIPTRQTDQNTQIFRDVRCIFCLRQRSTQGPRCGLVAREASHEIRPGIVIVRSLFVSFNVPTLTIWYLSTFNLPVAASSMQSLLTRCQQCPLLLRRRVNLRFAGPRPCLRG